MKKLLLAIVVAAMPATAFADSFVNGYVKKNGTYVQPHYRSSADSYKSNNWSTRGNVNPYTGQSGGTRPTYGSGSGGYNSSKSGLNTNHLRPLKSCGVFC